MPLRFGCSETIEREKRNKEDTSRSFAFRVFPPYHTRLARQRIFPRLWTEPFPPLPFARDTCKWGNKINLMLSFPCFEWSLHALQLWHNKDEDGDRNVVGTAKPAATTTAAAKRAFGAPFEKPRGNTGAHENVLRRSAERKICYELI